MLQAKEMGASGTEVGLIFGIYPLVVFVVAPVIGVLVSILFKFNYEMYNKNDTYLISSLK